LSDLARGNPVKMLFSQGYALQTVMLWIVYFCSLMNLFLFVYWLPEVLQLVGLTPAQAVFATTRYALGGVAAALYLGVLIDCHGPERALALHYAIGAAFIAAIALVSLDIRTAARGDLPRRVDDHRESDRPERHLRQALSGAHEHERPRLGDRGWADRQRSGFRRHRSSSAPVSSR
jgi:hypothetical protein